MRRILKLVAFLFWMAIKRVRRMQTEMQLSTKWKWKYNLWLHCGPASLVCSSFYSAEYISPSISTLPSTLSSLSLSSLLILDYKGLPASDAGAAARPCSVHKLHPVPVSHPWGHRLLHLQGLIAGLHGEPDAGPAGLSRCWLHHRASLSHQYRDVPGHESQVFKCVIVFLFF